MASLHSRTFRHLRHLPARGDPGRPGRSHGPAQVAWRVRGHRRDRGRRPDLRVAHLGPRGFELLPRGADAVHAGVAPAVRGLDPRQHQVVRGPTPDIVAGLARHVRADLGEGEDDEQKYKGTDITYCLAESGTAGPTGGESRNRTPGYVALAVECDKGCFTREVETGLGNDREANMVRFAVEGLKFLKDVIQGDAKL
ncbi:hypothetical protein PG984_003662 [Apiospora sp. TS-2023a]